MRRINAGLSCLSAAALVAVAVPSYGDPSAGRLLASQCAQCHGTDGRSVTDLETLAGADAKDMLNELLDMKYSDDTDDIMIRQAKGYSDVQLRLIAEYFSTVPGNSEDGEGED